MNFVFICPNTPKTYYHFCENLRKNKINVLGIGDSPYDNLSHELRMSLNEYYKVSSLDNYDEVYKAVAFFIFKYGRIDFIESNNEYFLRTDAMLRTDFNIRTGASYDEVLEFTAKSNMKKHYKEANVKTARFTFAKDFKTDMEFVNLVGFPVIYKPDHGVGANKTYRIKNEYDIKEFYLKKPVTEYIIEEYIDGDIISYDGIVDSNSDVVVDDMEVFPKSIMDIVNENLEISYYVMKYPLDDLRDIGKRVLKAFNVKQRFFHLEFFRLTTAKPGLGEIGDIVALEVNMRPPGGYTPDLINYSGSFDLYKIYADVIAYNKTSESLDLDKYYALYFGRRDRFSYSYDFNKIKDIYKNELMDHGNMENYMASALGNEYYILKFDNLKELEKARELIGLKK